MTVKKYCARHGKLYGVSWKPGTDSVYVRLFNNVADAQAWLHAEEYDFRERELCSKSRAIQLAGRRAVREAEVEDYEGFGF